MTATVALTAAADPYAVRPFSGDISQSLVEMDRDIYILMLSTCGDPGRGAEASALKQRHDDLRTDWLRRSGRPYPEVDEIFVLETNCFRPDQFDDRAMKLRRKLAAAREAMDRQFPR